MIRGRRPTLALVLILAAAAVLRLHAFAQDPPLSPDEAALALNVATRSARGLLAPLDFAQVAPPLFLGALRLAVVVAGVSEGALRAAPLLAALALPFVFWRRAATLLDPTAALAATALLGASPLLVRYAGEAKPYALDALAAAVLLALTLPVRDHPDQGGRWWALGLAGALAFGASLPSPFVAAGVVVSLALTRLEPRPRRRLALLAAAWAALAAALAFTLHAAALRDPYLRAFHGTAADHPVAALRLLSASLLGGVATRSMDAFGLAAAALAASGLVGLGRRFGAGLVALLAAPPLLGLAAAFAGAYGAAPRLFLFALPALALALGAGLDALASRLPAAYRTPAVVLGTLALLAPSLGGLAASRTEGGGRALAERVEAERGAGEPVYVAARGLTVWAFETTDWSAPDLERLALVRAVAGSPASPAFENADRRGRRTLDQGRGLLRASGGRVEVFGLSTGRQWRYLEGFVTPAPDPGWAEVEAERVLGAGASGAWVFFGAAFDGADEALHRALEERGARRQAAFAEGGARLYRYTYGPPADERQSAKPGQPPGASSR